MRGHQPRRRRHQAGDVGTQHQCEAGDSGQSLVLDTIIEGWNGMSCKALDTLVDRPGGARSPVVDTQGAGIQAVDLDRRAKLISAIHSMKIIRQGQELELHRLQEEFPHEYGQVMGSGGCSVGSGGLDEAKLLNSRKAELRLKLAMRVRR